eukprot:gene48222-53578_t
MRGKGHFAEAGEGAADHLGFGAPPAAGTLALFREFEPRRVTYEGEWDEQGILRWIRDESLPLCTVLTKDNAAAFFGQGDGDVPPLATAVYLTYEAAPSEAELSALRAAAGPLRGKVAFAAADGSWDQLVHAMAVNGATLPATVVVNGKR